MIAPPARGKKYPAVKLHRYDGGLLPERPEELGPDRRLPESGTIFVGSKRKLISETYAGPFTETVLLGNLAVAFPGKKLYWDGAALKVTNDADANALVQHKYREGWRL